MRVDGKTEVLKEVSSDIQDMGSAPETGLK